MGSQSGFWKFALWFVAIIVLALLAFVGVRMYQFWRTDQNLRAINKSFEDAAARAKEAQMKDTYGGKTPQETLSLYISAVEKGDYELASKYFILEKQEGELKKLKYANSEDVNKYIAALRGVANNSGKYDSKKTYFSFDGKILISLTLYPTGLWKIIEI